MGVVWDAALRPDRPAWAEVDLAAIAANAAALRKQAGSAELLAVVKADGYGHGLEASARAALAGGATWIGVALLSEALQLRDELSVTAGEAAAGQTWAQAWPDARLLVFGYTPPEQAAAAVAADVRLACDSIELAEALAGAAQAIGKQARIHVKVDTGMGRTGLTPATVPAFMQRLQQLPAIVVEGVFTHLADAENAHGSYTQGQLAAFADLKAELDRLGLSPPVWHAGNSAATLRLGGGSHTLVRPGIALYGYDPSPGGPAALEPALTWKAVLVHSKVVPAGSAIGYGCTFRAPEEMGVGTVPIGYADGYSRHWSNRGEVLCRGQRLPVIGRVCMDQFMVSLEPLRAGGGGHVAGAGPAAEADRTAGAGLAAGLPAVGEEVVLLGRQGDEQITADELAAGLDTISYEVLSLIGRRVPRLYTWRGTPVGCRNSA